MVAARKTACVLLAAGQSRRFGPQNKLLQNYEGKPLARHSAETLAQIPLALHIAIVSQATAGLFEAPFVEVLNATPSAGLSSSIAMGVQAAADGGAEACLIALADMPLVPREHFEALLEALGPPDVPVVATRGSQSAQVPAVFAREHFGSLTSLSGDEGARGVLAHSPAVTCDQALLRDFDRREDFS